MEKILNLFVYFLILCFSITFIKITNAKGVTNHSAAEKEKIDEAIPKDEASTAQTAAEMAAPKHQNSDQKDENESKIKLEAIEKRMDEQLNKVLAERFPTLVIKLDELAHTITEAEQPPAEAFLQKLIDEARPIYVDGSIDLMLLLAKLRRLSNDPTIKNEVVIAEVLEAVADQAFKLNGSFSEGLQEMHTYHNGRAKLQRELQRSQGDEALIEYDQKFIDELFLNLEENRDFGITLRAMMAQIIGRLMESEEKTEKDKKQNHFDFYN